MDLLTCVNKHGSYLPKAAGVGKLISVLYFLFSWAKNVHPWVRSTYLSSSDVMWSEVDFYSRWRSTRTHTLTLTHRCTDEAHYIHKTYMSEGTPTCPQVYIIPCPPQWSLILSPTYPEYPFITSACALKPSSLQFEARGYQHHKLGGMCCHIWFVSTEAGSCPLGTGGRAEQQTQFIRLLARTWQTDDLSVLESDLKFNNNNASVASALQEEQLVFRERFGLAASPTRFRPACYIYILCPYNTWGWLHWHTVSKKCQALSPVTVSDFCPI